ncbi:hypothetical protein LCGC14_1311630 [marine sediment metagenome]|uniref:Uncharacterized protein n=1 Tax=marine sediment metagenome TaxID=412755 RepID=A0A0F9KMM6_9ZZZZ
MAEEYVESILIRQDNNSHVPTPMFEDGDLDGLFEFESILQLKQIEKSIQNAVHNRHTYVFKIVSIDKMQKEE